MTEQIVVKNVTFEYQLEQRRVLALKDISFTVRQSEFLCLLGPSGCGKTTMLNVLAGLLQPTSGEVLLQGQSNSPDGGDRGVVFQDFSQLFPWRTAQKNVEFGLEIRGVGREERRAKAAETLTLVGLEKFGDAYPHQLSGGMQQRVAIARSLAYDPQVLLMDEPFAALDNITREDMQTLLTDVWRRTRKTVIYITHNVAEAVFLGDRVIILNAHPGTIKSEVVVDIPRPRDPLSNSFVALQRAISDALRQKTTGGEHA